jgi:uncharacterized membrane protein YfcA
VPHLSATTVFIAIAAMAIGSAFQAALGIGMALFAVPVLALVDPGFIPGPTLFAGSLLTAVTAYGERRAIERRRLGVALIGLAAGTVGGAVALRLAAGANIERVFGTLILVAVLISIFGKPVAMSGRNLLIGAGAAGIMGTMVGIHGPAISLVFQRAEPAVARAMLGAIFTIAYLGSVAALVCAGLFGRAELVRAVVLVPGVAAGLALAPFIRRLVDRRRLRAAILTAAAVSGALLIAR